MKKIAILAMSAMCVLALAGCNKSKGPSEAALKAAENGDYSKLPVAKDPASKKAYDFGGKTIIPFATSGGSGMGGSGMNIGALAKDAHVIEGKRFAAGVSEDELKKWASTWI